MYLRRSPTRCSFVSIVCMTVRTLFDHLI